MAAPFRKSGRRAAEERATVSGILKQHLGGRIKRIAPQGGGFSNLVYSIRHSEGEFVVRLNPDRAKSNPFLKEQWAAARARRIGIPAPEILHVGHMPMPYMILRRSPGEPAISHPERKGIIRQLGEFAARINSIRTHGFGGVFDWSQNRLSIYPNWEDFLNAELQLSRRLRVLKRLRMLPAVQLKTVRAVLESANEKDRKPALNHGDLRLKNVLVDRKGRITAILDWENAMSNLAPEWDFSVALHDLSIDDKQEFFSGYGHKPKAVASLNQTVKALNIINYVPELERFAEARDTRMIELYRLRLGGAFDLYSI
jgi:aminoglycoside phosphotransferase (APT) family kinase protein